MKTYFLVFNKMNAKKLREIVKAANEFDQCQIYIEYKQMKMNAKSLLSVSLLLGKQGLYCIYATGKNCRTALESLRAICTEEYAL
ncbi:HPr family phosphocarrier protein [Fictibacillus sp. Mic-4]|uniref:HPr family phosphocarrier protein n=1 Tax=Fictibacillus TaxID=1329200 RepID=UPI0004207017|nr:HPr family phosphocarrier protein [Fictibacillus gelatini]